MSNTTKKTNVVIKPVKISEKASNWLAEMAKVQKCDLSKELDYAIVMLMFFTDFINKSGIERLFYAHIDGSKTLHAVAKDWEVEDFIPMKTGQPRQ